MKYRNRFLLISFCAGLALPGCLDFKAVKAPTNEQDLVEEPDPNLLASEIGFAEVQRYVFIPYCVRCHSGSRPAGDVNLSNYASAVADTDVVYPGVPLASTLYTEIANGGMPENSAPLSTARMNLIYKWIKAGAPEKPSDVPSEPGPAVSPIPTGTPVPTPTPSPTPVTAPDVPPVYADIRDALIVPSCLKCHGHDKPARKIDLSSYEAIMANSKLVNPGNPQGSSLYVEIATGKMPKRKPPIDPILTNLVYDWIKNGAPKERPSSPGDSQ